MNFTRQELWALQERAEHMAKNTPNENWQRAYLRLAEACNILDAHFGRSSVGIPTEGSTGTPATVTLGS